MRAVLRRSGVTSWSFPHDDHGQYPPVLALTLKGAILFHPHAAHLTNSRGRVACGFLFPSTEGYSAWGWRCLENRGALPSVGFDSSVLLQRSSRGALHHSGDCGEAGPHARLLNVSANAGSWFESSNLRRAAGPHKMWFRRRRVPTASFEGCATQKNLLSCQRSRCAVPCRFRFAVALAPRTGVELSLP